MTSTSVHVEEHPELDNPRGKAEGRVQAAETFLGEGQEAVRRLEGKVVKAVAALELAKEQLLAAQDAIPGLEADLNDAREALAGLLESEQ